jgi:hypothetical protein
MKKYEQYFLNKEDFKKFIEFILVGASKNVSFSINDVYDYYDEIEFTY